MMSGRAFAGLAVGNGVRSLVVRPRKEGKMQILAFRCGEIRELVPDLSSEQRIFRLSEDSLPLAAGAPLPNATTSAAYEPTTDSVYFNAFEGGAKRLMRLDSQDRISAVAGRLRDEPSLSRPSGPIAAVSFANMYSLAADGRGGLLMTGGRDVYRLHLGSGDVTKLQGLQVPSSPWTALSYDTEAEELVAAVPDAVYRIPISSVDREGRVTSAPRLVAGSEETQAQAGGRGRRACFDWIRVILAGAGGYVYIADGPKLCLLDANGVVRTLAKCGSVPGWGAGFCVSLIRPPPISTESDLVVSLWIDGTFICCKANFAPRSDVREVRRHTARSAVSPRAPPPPAGAEFWELLTVPARGEGQGSGDAPVVEVTVSRPSGPNSPNSPSGATKKTFAVHRKALLKRSGYFQRLLESGSGGGTGGSAAAVSLPDTDPEAFAWLLPYMYGMPQEIPDKLLLPVLELAVRLQMAAECTTQLQARLVRTVTPGSVVADLCWASQHDMAELVSQLKGCLLQHRREVAAVAGAVVDAGAGAGGGAGAGAGADGTAVQTALQHLAATQSALAAEIIVQLLLP